MLTKQVTICLRVVPNPAESERAERERTFLTNQNFVRGIVYFTPGWLVVCEMNLGFQA